MTLVGVTGASGFIGSQFVKLARMKGYELRLFARDHEGAQPLDLGLPEVDPGLFAGCDAIVHLAARLPSGACDLVEARECWEINALGTIKLMRAMHSAGVTRLIQTTSANAYSPSCGRPNEESPLYPLSRSFYLGSKMMQELYAQACGVSNGIEVTTLRVSSSYGPSVRSTVGRMAGALLRGEMIRLENGGSFGADFILVSDVARALLLLESLGQAGIWNVGSGYRTTMLEIGSALVELTGADLSLLRVEPLGSAGAQGFPAIDIDKIRSLGFVPTKLEVGLKFTIDELDPLRKY